MGFIAPIALAMGASASTAATLGTIGAAVGTGMQAFGAIQGFVGAKNQAKASANSNRYNAAVARNNAIIAQNNAAMEAAEGNAQVEAAQMENRAKIGAISAQQGASGVDMNYGSAVDVRSSAAQTGQLNAINIRSNAVRKAYGYQQNAKDYESQAGLYESQAKNDLAAGDLNASTTLLGGLAEAGMGYNDYLEKRGV